MKYSNRLRIIEQRLPPDQTEVEEFWKKRIAERAPIARALKIQGDYEIQFYPKDSGFLPEPGTIFPTEEEYQAALKILYPERYDNPSISSGMSN